MTAQNEATGNSVPTSPHEAVKAGWEFSNQINDLLAVYEKAVSDLSQKENAYTNAESKKFLDAPAEETVPYKKAWVAQQVQKEFEEFNTAKNYLAGLKVLLDGRKQQLSFAQTAVSFLKAEWEQSKSA